MSDLAATVTRMVETLMALQQTVQGSQAWGTMPGQQSAMRQYLRSLGSENGVFEASKVNAIIGRSRSSADGWLRNNS